MVRDINKRDALDHWHGEIPCDKRRISCVVVDTQTEGEYVGKDGRLRLCRGL